MKRRGLDGKILTKQDIIRHKELLRECGLPDTLNDPTSRETLEKIYPHLKMSEDEREVRRIVNIEFGGDTGTDADYQLNELNEQQRKIDGWILETIINIKEENNNG